MIESVCVSIAMYCLVQFYVQLKDDISQYQPFLKIVSIKLVIFLSFWQTVRPDVLFPDGESVTNVHLDSDLLPHFFRCDKAD